MLRRQSNSLVFAILIACFVGVAQAQENRDTYILLIDTSSSMRETPKGWDATKIAEVKRQLGEFCTALPRETRVMIYTFDKKPPRVGPRLVIRNERDRDELRHFFSKLEATGGQTHAWSSLETVLGEARNLIKASPDTDVRLLMFTDGEDTEGRDLNAILKQFDDVLKNHVRTSYVMINFTLGEDLKKVLVDHSIEVVKVIDKEDLIPLDAAFGWAPSRVTTEVDVQFFDKTNARVDSHQWDFGDGNTSKSQTPTHRFARPGKYTVRLTVTGITGKNSRIERVVEVVPPEPITAAGSFGPAQANLGQEVKFVNESKGGVTEFEWQFGDGETSTDEHPTHVYKKPGEYSVRLSVSRGAAKKSVTLEQAVVIQGPPAPTARVFAARNGLTDEQLEFRDASIGGPIDNRIWDFGDGSEAEHGSDVAHVYAKAGKYVVKLRVTGPGGEDAATHTVEIVAPPRPQPAIFVGTDTPRVDEAVKLADQTRQPVDTATWDFGDGSSALQIDYRTEDVGSKRAVQHTYRRPGHYDVRLTVAGPGGTDSTTEQLEIKGYDPPVAKIVVGAEPHVGEPAVFSDASTGVVARATWRFGDDTEPLSVSYGDQLDPAKRTVRHTYSRSGTYEVTLQVEGPGGKSDGRVGPVTVHPSERIPKALFEVSQATGRGELHVRFTNQSSGPISRYVWDFGDGTSRVVQESKQDIEHKYSPGTFSPTLTVEGTQGLAPDTYRPDAPIVVKQPWPSWLKHLFWAVPVAFIALLAVGFGVREARWRSHLRELRVLTGSLRCQPANDIAAPLDPVEVFTDRDPSTWAFRLRTSEGDGSGAEYQGQLRKTVTVIKRPATETTYTLELSRGSSPIGSALIEDGERASIGPFTFEYRES